MDQDNSRRELARFLRTRRERITPADVGLPPGSQRRAPGLRREEVAVLAGLSPTWYAYLEQGRDIHPSGEVLDSLARVLSLTEDERRYMHKLARAHVVKPRPLVSDLSPAEIMRQLVGTAENSPYPAYGVDIYCELIAWNRAATTYYTDFGSLPDGKCNMLRWMFSPEAKERILDWTEDARDVVARWRAASAPISDARMHALVTELSAESPEFSRWWAEHDVREHRSRIRRFQHPRLGQLSLRLIVVQTPEFTPGVVVFHFPASS